MVFLAGKSPNVRLLTVYIYSSGKPYAFGICMLAVVGLKKHVFVAGLAITIYMRCIYGIFGREITKYTVINGVHMVFLAGKSPNVRSLTVYIYGYGQPYACDIHALSFSHCWRAACGLVP